MSESAPGANTNSGEMKTLRQGDAGFVPISRPTDIGYDKSAPIVEATVVDKTPHTSPEQAKSVESQQRAVPSNKPDSNETGPRNRNDGQKLEQKTNPKANNSDKKDNGDVPKKESEDFSKMDFSDLNSLRKNFAVEPTRRSRAEQEFNRRVETFKNLRDGGVVNEVRHHYLTLVRSTDWDGLYVAVSDKADELEDNFEKRSGKQHPELRGVITEVLNVERAQLLLEGMKRVGVDWRDVVWLKEHGFTQKDCNKFQELILPVNAVLDIERMDVETLADMVGKDIVKPVQPQAVIDYDKMQTSVKKGTEEAINAPSIEAERKAFRTAEYQMSSTTPAVDSRTKFLLEASDREILLWNTRAQLARACAIKMNGGMNEIAGNPELKAFKNEQEQLLLAMPGVLEEISLEAHMIVNEAEMDTVLRNNLDPLPETIFDITEETALDRFRQAKIEWLKNYVFVDGGGQRRHLTEDEAKDAEAVSRNYIYINDLVEDFDSVADKNDQRTKTDHRLIPNSMPKLKSVAVWQTMHLQERLEAKNKNDANWSAFGAFANSHPRSINDLLPLNLFKSALEIGKDQNTVGGDPEDERTLLQVFVENGAKLAMDPRSEITTPAISHPNAKEGRFSGYCAVTLSDAATVMSALSKPNDIRNTNNWAPLGDALRSLDVDYKYRYRIAMAIRGIDTRFPWLSPYEGATSFYKFLYGNDKDSLNRFDPRFFASNRTFITRVFDAIKKIINR